MVAGLKGIIELNFTSNVDKFIKPKLMYQMKKINFVTFF